MKTGRTGGSVKSVYHQSTSHRFLKLFIVFVLVAGLFVCEQSYAATASSVSQFGITWTFDKAYTVGQFANGDYWVIGPVTIVGINPPSTSVGGRIKNGAMVNPTPTSENQGYDTAMMQYVSSLNRAYNVSSSNPLTLQAGSSLVSCISIDAVDNRPQLRSAAILTVLSSAPAAGSFRPPYSGTDKTIKFNKSQLNYSLLGKLPPISNTPRLKQQAGDVQNASVERMFERPWVDHRAGWYNDWYHPSENMEHYGRDLSTQIGIGALMLNMNYTDAEKETLMIRFTQLGIDFYGIFKAGGLRNWEPDGGTASGRKWPILFAGLVLGDSAMSSIGQNAINNPYFGEDSQTFYVQQTSPGVINYGYGGYSSSDIGRPEYGIRHATYPDMDNKVWDSSYRRCCTANAWGGIVLAARIMNAKAAWGHDALFDYMDRYMATEPSSDFRQWSPFVERMWDTYRAQFGPIWPNTAPSNQLPTANAGPDQTITDADGNGSESVALNGSGSRDSDGSISSYVWTRNSSQIATGVSPTVTLPTGQNVITLTVTDNGGAKASDTVVINVVAKDTTPPSVVSVDGYTNSVEILFSEALNQTTAQTVPNYSINNGISVTAAALNTQYNTVTLTTSALSANSTYSVTIANVKDAAGNTMPTTTKTCTYNDGMAGYWKFDDANGTTASDSSSSGNNGTLINQPSWTTGKYATGIDLNADNQAVQIPTKDMDITKGTITMWVNPASFPSLAQFMFGHVDSSWANRIQIYTNNSSGGLGIGLGDTHQKATNIFNLPLNTWTHVALTWNGSGYSVYVNGAQKTSGTYTGLSALSASADIANTGNSSDRNESFDGIIDEVKIYNRPLTAAEITDNYNSVPYLAFYPIGDKQIDEGKPLTFTVQTVTPGTTVQLESNNLPTAPTFTNNTFTWTPSYTASGTYEATFVALSGQVEDYETITITVNNANRKPVISPIGNKTVNEGQTLTFTVTATDPDGQTVTISGQNMPTGASLTGNNFTWTPTSSQSGTYNVTFTASDGGLTDSQTITITVNDVAVSDPTLIGYWKFNEGSGSTAADSSGKGKTGTLINQPSWVTGKFSSAIRMQTLPQGVEVPTSGMGFQGTIAMWVNPTSFPNTAQFMFGHVSSTWSNRIQIYTNNTNGALGIGLGDTHRKGSNIYNLPLNTWTHVALTWNGSNYYVYVNGTQRATGTYSGLNAITGYADIGNTGNRSDRSEAFMGSIDDARIYNRVLSASEISSLYSLVP